MKKNKIRESFKMGKLRKKWKNFGKLDPNGCYMDDSLTRDMLGRAGTIHCDNRILNSSLDVT